MVLRQRPGRGQHETAEKDGGGSLSKSLLRRPSAAARSRLRAGGRGNQQLDVFEQTRDDSLTDPLTTLPNTRFLYMHLVRTLARAERLKLEVGLLVMNLDDLTGINRTHGYHVGDRALIEVARILRTGIRPYDVCVRYQASEFIVVLSDCGADEAEQKRLELKRSVDDLHFETERGRRLKLTISSGGAIFPHDGQTYEALFVVADSRRDADSRRKH